MTLEEAEIKLENMNFDDIVKSYCNKVNYIEILKNKSFWANGENKLTIQDLIPYGVELTENCKI